MFERRIGIVELPIDHLVNIHHRNAGSPAVLQELGIRDPAVVIHDERHFPVLTQDDVRRISERRAIEAPGIHTALG